MTASRDLRDAELLRLRDWCFIVVQFLREIEPGFDRERSLERSYEAGYQTRNLRGFRAAARDLLEMVEDIPASHKARLEERLRERFGTGLEPDREAMQQELTRVLKRGRIANEREFHLLRARARELEPESDECQRINSLLFRYETRNER